MNVEERLAEIVDEMAQFTPIDEYDVSWDLEMNHLKADGLLCEALRLLGQDSLVDMFEKVDKWYA